MIFIQCAEKLADQIVEQMKADCVELEEENDLDGIKHLFDNIEAVCEMKGFEIVIEIPHSMCTTTGELLLLLLLPVLLGPLDLMPWRVGWSVGWSVGRSVSPSVNTCNSATNFWTFFKIGGDIPWVNMSRNVSFL